MVSGLGADPSAGLVNFVRGSPRYERRIRGHCSPRSDFQHGPPACIRRGYFLPRTTSKWRKCFSLWGPSRQELNSAEIFALSLLR